MLTGKQTNFKNYIIAGKEPSQAYRLAYDAEAMLPETISNNAYKLLHENNEIATMVAEGRQNAVSELVETRKWTAEKLATEAETNLTGARQDHAWAPANRAVELMARLTGNLEPAPATEIRITKVTVVLPPSVTGSLEPETMVDITEYKVE